jgi:hypothetical protein
MRTAISERSPLEKTPPLNTNLFKVFGSLRNEPAFFRIDSLSEQIFGLNEQVRRRGPSD